MPVLCPGCKDPKEAFASASQFALSEGIISFGDVVVVTAGVPFGKKGTTNMMIVENIGDILVRGHIGFGPKMSGRIFHLLSPETANIKDVEGKIAVISHCDNTFMNPLKRAKGIILQNWIGDASSEKYAIALAKSLEIPVMTRADGAISMLKPGEEVTLDPGRGLVYRGSEETVTSSIFSF